MMLGLGSYPAEGIDVCNCIMPLRHRGTLNNHRAPDYTQGTLPQNWGATEPNYTVTCMVLKATDNDRLKSSPLQLSQTVSEYLLEGSPKRWNVFLCDSLQMGPMGL
ncbi:hypothetical protein TNCV_3587381 [Trichonephila clavipes]|nr:hypothetical protein TNCV_3587381 [Trichonephila clavipes]